MNVCFVLFFCDILWNFAFFPLKLWRVTSPCLRFSGKSALINYVLGGRV